MKQNHKCRKQTYGYQGTGVRGKSRVWIDVYTLLYIKHTPSKNLWRREWQPTPVFLPGEFHGQRSLAATVHGVAKSQTQLND